MLVRFLPRRCARSNGRVTDPNQVPTQLGLAAIDARAINAVYRSPEAA
jgi:hypothetical protein